MELDDVLQAIDAAIILASSDYGPFDGTTTLVAFGGVGLVTEGRPSDLDAIYALRVAAEQWLAGQGIDQWRAGEVTLLTLRDQLDRREWHVLRDAEAVIGALRLLWSDPAIWQDDDRSAAYVHGLVIDRNYAGRAVGAELVEWAEQQARQANASVVRLDCASTNPRLRRYYTRLGFREVGLHTFPTTKQSVTLMERPVR